MITEAEPARFAYDGENGEPVGCVDRHDLPNGKKRFVQHRFEDGKYVSGLRGIVLPLYRLPDVRARVARGQVVFITEGERKADALHNALRQAKNEGVVTTLAGGANAQLLDEHLHELRGLKRAIVLADSDAPGRKAAHHRAHQIADAFPDADVRIVDFFPDRDDGLDVDDWLAAGPALETFRSFIAAATPVEANQITLRLKDTRESERPEGKAQIVLRPLAAIEARSIDWLWQYRIARGEPTVLAGVPGVGKSTAAASIATAITRGWKLPSHDGPTLQGDVILLALEDDAARVLRPRYEKLGADLSRIHILEGVQSAGEERVYPFTLRHVELLENALRARPETVLIIVDPIASLFGGIDMGRSNEVRQLVDPFLSVASQHDVASLLIAHVNKSQVSALNRVEGSFGGFVGRARCVLAAGRIEQLQKRGVGLLKSNLGPTDVPTIEYEIDTMGRFSWTGENPELHASRLFEPAETEPDREASSDASAALLEALADGPRSARELDRYLVDECRFSRRTIERVRAKLARDGRIVSRRHGFGAPVIWETVGASDEPATSILRHTSPSPPVGEQWRTTADNGAASDTEADDDTLEQVADIADEPGEAWSF